MRARGKIRHRHLLILHSFSKLIFIRKVCKERERERDTRIHHVTFAIEFRFVLFFVVELKKENRQENFIPVFFFFDKLLSLRKTRSGFVVFEIK